MGGNQRRRRGYGSMGQSAWRERLTDVMAMPAEEAGETTINVGLRLKALREAKGLSLRALAERSGLNVNTLSLIENQRTSPRVDTMQQLAEALRVHVTDFFEPVVDEAVEIIHQRWGKRPATAFPHGLLEDLGGGMALGEATPLLLTANPHTHSGDDAITHTGQEFVYCLEGRIHYRVGSAEFTLGVGDSLIFQAHLPHRWENREDKICRTILIISPADHDDYSVEQHLKYQVTNVDARSGD